MKTDDFIRDRKYLLNVSQKTLDWYAESFKWLQRYCPDEPTEEGLRNFVVGMREKGLKASSCNNRIRAVKAYLAWSGSPLKLGYLKEESAVLPVYTADQIAKFINFKPTSLFERRLQVLILLLLDTGIRFEEALTLPKEQVDFDSLLVTVKGKGNKERTIPFSLELRKMLWKHCKETDFPLVFSTTNGERLNQRNTLRGIKSLCLRLGFTAPRRSVHAFRHAFSISYLRNGGNLFYLALQLGHSSTKVTEGYLKAVSAQDLQQVHSQLSPLRRGLAGRG